MYYLLIWYLKGLIWYLKHTNDAIKRNYPCPFDKNEHYLKMHEDYCALEREIDTSPKGEIDDFLSMR